MTIEDIKKFKNAIHPFATLTAYDFNSAQILDAAGIPLILVGDSASMTMYGYKTTLPISMQEMLLVVRAVSRGAPRALVVADMPFLSYQPSVEETIKNAGLFMKEGGAQAVKLEGGQRIMKNIRALVEHGIPVLGHVGLTPQSFHQMSGYKIQGKTPEDAQKIIEDAHAVESSGAFGLVLECIPENLATQITQKLKIPTIGIGAGNTCNGQIQVFHDIMGLTQKPPPKHAKQYQNLYKSMVRAVKQYKSDIENS